MNDAAWASATRRFWWAAFVRAVGASIVISPAVSAFSLMLSHFILPGVDVTIGLSLLLGVPLNMLAWLWAMRQALLKTYPEGKFVLVAGN